MNQELASEQMIVVRRLLAEAGYSIFDIALRWRRTDLDILVAHKEKVTCPAWLYPSPKGCIVIRPWVATYESHRLALKVSLSYRKYLRLIKSSPMPPDRSWWEWVTPESKEEAKLLGFYIPD